jgi:dTMP kinase
LGLETVEKVHRLVVGSFEPDMVLILDIPESLALQRALGRGGAEDRFEKKGELYQSRVRQAFLQIASRDSQKYQVIDANQSIDEVTRDIFDIVNGQYQLSLEVNKGIE